jgi:hypothetical protein
MRSSISSSDAPSRVQRVISSRMLGMRGTSWVGTKSAPRSCPFLVRDYGELQTLARLGTDPFGGFQSRPAEVAHGARRTDSEGDE